jgi:CubicO group peptidase (beta-lactamase class C family)
MVKQLAAAPPVWDVGVRSGYHALTYGWLVGEVIRRVTGLTIDEAFQREIVEPLGLEGGMHVGAPESVRDRIAPPATDVKKLDRLFRMSSWLARFDRFRPLYDAMVVDDYVDYSLTPRIHDGEIPAANGVFTARSLARMYAASRHPTRSRASRSCRHRPCGGDACADAARRRRPPRRRRRSRQATP